ncbi:hypothetical protein AX16_007533 [Volvariella volvacea WC 439]|nr:hypothetical protein AX16_007533 [Volvariella volvacea WC 439]
MGQGGLIVLINGTPYAWDRVYQRSYQMNSWDFPTSIASGQTSTPYIEWDQGIFKNQKDDSGEATYQLRGTSYQFQVQARAYKAGDFHLKVYFIGMSTQNNNQGTTLELGWVHDGSVNFILSGQNGNFCSSNPPTNWMQTNISTLGIRTLRRLCIPGSHDTGMSRLTGGTAFAFNCNVLTQRRPIIDQLRLGARWFDIRPVITAGNFSTGHYSEVVDDKTWQGGNGQPMDEVIDQINEFTRDNKELIILELSHDLNTDVGNNAYRPFNQDEWNRLLDRLKSRLNNLFIAPNPTTVDLSTLNVNTYIGGNRAAVVVVVRSGIDISSYNSSGFYRSNQYSLYNRYAESNDLNKMSDDQFNKLREQRTSPDTRCFLLSWTLTQDAVQAAGCVTGVVDSIFELADKANPELYKRLLNNCSSTTYPNVLLIDCVDLSDIAALAMAVNNRFQ